MTKHCKDNEGIFSFGVQSSNTLMSGAALGFSQTGNNGAVAGSTPMLLLMPICKNKNITTVCINPDGSVTQCPTTNGVQVRKTGIYSIHFQADVSSTDFAGQYPTYEIILNINTTMETGYFDYLYSTAQISHANVTQSFYITAGSLISLGYAGFNNPTIANGLLVIRKLNREQVRNLAQFTYTTNGRNKLSPIMPTATTISNSHIRVSSTDPSIIKIGKTGKYNLHLYAGFLVTNNNAQFPEIPLSCGYNLFPSFSISRNSI